MAKKRSSTVYDDVHRSMEIRCRRWLIPLINETFREHYTGREEVVLGRNERFGKKLTGEIKKRITDSYFTIRTGKIEECYHFENQSTPDKSILKRVLEYDAMIAVENCVENGNDVEVVVPKAAVIYLRSNKNTPDKMRVRAKLPSGYVTYDVQVIKMEHYTVDDIFKKKLFFLIPFHIFVYENSFSVYNSSREEFDKLQKIYEDIIERLEQLVMKQIVDEQEYVAIIEMSMKVIENVARDYENIVKGFGDIMGGKFIETRGYQIYREGIAQGALDMCIRFIKQGTITIAEAAAQLDMTEDELKACM